MKAKDIFGLIFRLAALWLMLWGAWNLLAAIVYLPRMLAKLDSNSSGVASSILYIVYGFPSLISGILGLLAADLLVNLTYRRPEEPNNVSQVVFEDTHLPSQPTADKK